MSNVVIFHYLNQETVLVFLTFFNFYYNCYFEKHFENENLIYSKPLKLLRINRWIVSSLTYIFLALDENNLRIEDLKTTAFCFKKAIVEEFIVSPLLPYKFSSFETYGQYDYPNL